jgi:exo-beta-1,3-glucanase (GH17 family)
VTVSSTSTVVVKVTKPTTATTTTYAVSTPAAPVVPVVPISYSMPAAPIVPAAPVVPAYSSPAPKSTPAASIKVNGKQWAMTYTPYTSSGQCKSAYDVDSDIANIAAKGFTTVRLYATDCSGLVNVGASCKTHGLKIIMGVFIKAAGIADARPQLAEIATWGKAGNWDLITMIVVGNEAIFNQYCSAADLAAFILEAKYTWSAAGYSGPVTTTEPVSSLLSSASALCSVIDVVAANIQPFFDGSVVAEYAGDFVSSQLSMVAAACPGKTAYNLECGWPNQGSPNGKSIPGPSQQAAAMKDITSKAGDVTVVFSYDNDAWKAAGPFGVEQYFGCSSLY